jgi:hypothetical protein
MGKRDRGKDKAPVPEDGQSASADGSEETISLEEEIKGHPDRGAAIIAAASVDGMLEQMLRHYLLDDPKAQKLMHFKSEMGSYEAKCLMAFGLRIIDADMHSDLVEIGWIRNRFAHRLSLPADETGYISFKSEQVALRCRRLTTPEKHPPMDVARIYSYPGGFFQSHDEIPRLPPPKEPRERFVHTCNMLMSMFLMTAVEFKKQPPPVPGNSLILTADTFLRRFPQRETQQGALPDQAAPKSAKRKPAATRATQRKKPKGRRGAGRRES